MRPMMHAVKRLFGDVQIEGAEVGVDTGYHAFQILSDWGDGLRLLHLIDINPDIKDVVNEKLQEFNNYQLYIGDSVELANTCSDESLEFVYLDDDHSYDGVTASCEAWWSKLKIGGVFGGHDYCKVIRKSADPTSKAVDDFIMNKIPFANPLQYLHTEHNDWWFVKQTGEWTVNREGEEICTI